MNTGNLSTLSAASTLTLETVNRHFQQWRNEKKTGERIPEHLWSEAIALVEVYGLSPVTRALRLSRCDLNKRCGILGSARRRRVGEAAAFIEVEPAVVAQAQRRLSVPACLELIRPDGLRLRIEPGDGLEPLTVLERFMGVG